jgi:hypothetical protein
MSGGRPPRPGDGPPDSGLTPLEQQRQKQIDNDFKSATKNIPNQKPKDPWGDVRPNGEVAGVGAQVRTSRGHNSIVT